MSSAIYGLLSSTPATEPEQFKQMPTAADSRLWHDDCCVLAAGTAAARLHEGGPKHAVLSRATPLDAADLARGDSLPERLRGPFALALWDADERRGLLAIDRFGVEPLYYTVREGRLHFASSLEMLLRISGAPATLDPNALHAYLRFHAVPSPLTIYQNIHKLRPGECLRFHAGTVTQERYWRLQFDERPDSIERLASEFRDRVEAAVTTNIAATGTTGAFLSGGTDSSTVTGYLCRAHPRASTYSIGFAAEGYDEMEYARIASRHFGSNARELYVTADDVVAGVPLIAAAYDEPFGNASAVPAYHCARLAAADGITRVLAGDGGDETFGGNARYAKQLTFESYRHLPGALRAGALEPLLLHTALGGLPLLRKGRSFIEQARVPLPDRLETYNLMNRQPLADVLHPDLLQAVDPEYPLQLLRDTYADALTGKPLNRMLHLDLKFTLADNDLRKVTRTAELAGIDVRFPLLDEDLVAFSGRLPVALKVRGRQLRWFFKHALRDFLPREILHKSKHGFGLPFGLWLREHPGLRALAEDSLHGLGQRGLIRPEYIDRVFDLHRTGHAAYYGVMIWVLLMLEQWLRSHPAPHGAR